MSNESIIGFIITGVGIAFGFGKQAANILSLRNDVESLGRLHRSTIQELHELSIILARLEQRLLYLEK